MSRALIISAVLHGLGFAMVLIAPSPRAPHWQPPDAIAVDLVGGRRPAPKPAPVVETPPAESAPEEAAPPKEDPRPKPQESTTVKTPTKKSPKVPAPRVLKPNAPRRPADDGPTLEERIRQRLAKVGESADEAEPAASAPLTSAPGGPASGVASSADVQAVDFPFAWYLNVLRTRLTDAWDPPGESLVVGRGKRVLVAFRVARDGSVDNIAVSGASGTPGLDASARAAVERAQPFPPLPEAYPGATLDVAVRFTVGGDS